MVNMFAFDLQCDAIGAYNNCTVWKKENTDSNTTLKKLSYSYKTWTLKVTTLRREGKNIKRD